MASDFENLESKAKEIFEDMYYKLEARIKNLTNQVKKNILPDTEEKLKKNVFKTVIFSFGVGFVIGIILTLFGISSGKKK
jgi:ElaB/YqjD/DUF883 family membrane-anchored ribosome-binding protein